MSFLRELENLGKEEPKEPTKEEIKKPVIKEIPKPKLSKTIKEPIEEPKKPKFEDIVLFLNILTSDQIRSLHYKIFKTCFRFNDKRLRKKLMNYYRKL
jgi:hypothetical protein